MVASTPDSRLERALVGRQEASDSSEGWGQFGDPSEPSMAVGGGEGVLEGGGVLFLQFSP